MIRVIIATTAPVQHPPITYIILDTHREVSFITGIIPRPTRPRPTGQVAAHRADPPWSENRPHRR